MKLGTKDVKFVGIIPWFGRRGLRFVGRGNTIQLLETALVIEGNQKTIGLFIVDILFQQALSEWTTVTVPYSRVEGCRFKRMWLAKLLVLTPLFLCLYLPCLVGIISVTTTMKEFAEGFGVIMGVELAIVTALVIYLAIRFLGARHFLMFQRADGQRMLTCFHIRKRAMRKAFEELLQANRQTATSPSARSEEPKTTVIGGPNA
jgi:hypothetical protein